MNSTPIAEKDLSFKPIENANPKILSQEQITFYNREGYLMPFNAFSSEDANANRSYFDQLIEKFFAHREKKDTYAINGYQINCKGIYDIAMNDAILDHVSDLVGPNIICWATHFFCKQPYDKKQVAWHQDASYWPLSPARTVTVWLAIDDTDIENSAMKFIPRTHDKGHLKWRKVDTPSVLDQEIENAEQYGVPVYDELKAGDFSMHADMLVHGSDPNHSSRRRCGLTMRYCAPEVMPNGWGTRAIVCRGENTNPEWTQNSRPEGDDVTSDHKSIGAN